MKVNVNLDLSVQALIALAALVVIGVWPAVLSAIYSPKFLIDNLPAVITSAFVIVLFMLIRVYEINCFVYGNCVMHSWLMTGLMILIAIGYCVYLFRHARGIDWQGSRASARQSLEQGVRDSINQVTKNKVINTIARGNPGLPTQ